MQPTAGLDPDSISSTESLKRKGRHSGQKQTDTDVLPGCRESNSNYSVLQSEHPSSSVSEGVVRVMPWGLRISSLGSGSRVRALHCTAQDHGFSKVDPSCCQAYLTDRHGFAVSDIPVAQQPGAGMLPGCGAGPDKLDWSLRELMSGCRFEVGIRSC